MAKRRPVIHVASGKVFATAAEAERAFNLPNSVLSEAIRLGKPCHGEIFRFADDQINESASISATSVSSDPNPGVPSSSYSRPKSSSSVPTKYGSSATDKRAASDYFNSKGYVTSVESGVVMFYESTLDVVAKAVADSGYNASWGCYPGTREEYLARRQS